jgi:hypothetical protein
MACARSKTTALPVSSKPGELAPSEILVRIPGQSGPKVSNFASAARRALM